MMRTSSENTLGKELQMDYRLTARKVNGINIDEFSTISFAIKSGVEGHVEQMMPRRDRVTLA